MPNLISSDNLHIQPPDHSLFNSYVHVLAGALLSHVLIELNASTGHGNFWIETSVRHYDR